MLRRRCTFNPPVAREILDDLQAQLVARFHAARDHYPVSWFGASPPDDALPAAPPPSGGACFNPLGDGQIQLIVGTLSQTVGAPSHGSQEHAWQLVRFYEEDNPHRLLVERIVFTRNQRTGPFLPVAGADPDAFSEVTAFDL